MQLPPQAWLQDDATQILLAAFSHADVPLRFVGGCVRDAVMQRPVKDIDACSPAKPEQVMAVLEQTGIKVIPTGIAHGTVTAVIDHRPYEITTLRTDIACDGRHAAVAYTDDWKADAARRDFTLNALYCDAQGNITDFFNGIEAARAGRILFIGDARQRIEEDALRILRFFRFFATHGQAPADDTALAACAELRGRIAHLSGERIQHEMFKLLAAPNPLPALQHMQETGVLHEVLPDIAIPAAPLSALYRAPCAEIIDLSARKYFISLALLLRTHSDPAQAGQQIFNRWKLSNRDRQQLQVLTLTPPAPLPENETALIRMLRRHGRYNSMALLLRNQCEQQWDPSRVAPLLTRAQAIDIPQFPVTGRDLLKSGIAQGPELGSVLEKLEAAWEESGYRLTKPELLQSI